MYYQDPIGFQVAGLSVGASAWVDALWEFDILAGIEKVLVMQNNYDFTSTGL